MWFGLPMIVTCPDHDGCFPTRGAESSSGTLVQVAASEAHGPTILVAHAAQAREEASVPERGRRDGFRQTCSNLAGQEAQLGENTKSFENKGRSSYFQCETNARSSVG